MIKISIVDDDVNALQNLERMLIAYDSEYNKGLCVNKFQNAEEYLKSKDTDSKILFLDVEMPNMSGMDLARKIRKTRTDIIIIFCTNYQQFAVNGYEVGAFGFIVKPIQQYAFRFYLNKAFSLLQHDSEGCLHLKIVGGQKVINIKDLTYVEVRQHNMIYHVVDSSGDVEEEVVQVRGTMQTVEKQLFSYDFKRCSVSYLVNLNAVQSISGNDVYLKKTVLPISRNRKKKFISEFMAFLSKREVVLK